MLGLPFILAAEDSPLGHVLDKTLLGPLPGLEWAGPLLTMNTLMMIVAAAIAVLVVASVANSIGTGPESQGNERYLTKGRMAQFFEVIILYLRDKVIYPQLGEDMGRKFAPLLLSLFFFILFNNLLGLVPLLDIQHLIGGVTKGDWHWAVIGGTATGRLSVTAALAVTVFIIWQINGIRSSGIGGWAKHFLGGGPAYLAPIMLPVELMGMFVKPVALALRLFANMTAGHVLLAVLLGFTAAAPKALGLLGAPISVVAILAAVGIMFLELFVAFLQAFIFMFLTTLFIAQLAHHHHDEHAHAEEHDEHHPAVHDHAAPVTA